MSKFCLNCGAEIADNVKFCTSCGKEVLDAGNVEPSVSMESDSTFGLGDAPEAPVTSFEKITDAEEIAPEPIPSMDSSTTQSEGTYSQSFTQSAQTFAEQPKDKPVLAIVSLVTGILSLICCCCCTYLGIALSIAAVVCGIIVLVQHMEGKGMAIAGICCGGVGFVLIVICMVMGAAIGSTEAIQDIIEEIERSL